MNIDQFTAKYVELRDRRSVLKKEYEGEDAKLKLMMEKIEGRLQMELDALGAESMKTAHGTVFKTFKEFAGVADFAVMLAYIIKHEAWEMFEKRVSKTAVRDIMEPRADGSYVNPPPPGVNFSRTETVQIRRR